MTYSRYNKDEVIKLATKLYDLAANYDLDDDWKLANETKALATKIYALNLGVDEKVAEFNLKVR
jgi:hypothetical protein